MCATYQPSKKDTNTRSSDNKRGNDNSPSVPEAKDYLQDYRRFEQNILDALLLDFSIYPGPSRSGVAIIEISYTKQAKPYHRLHCLRLCHKWGWSNPNLPYGIRLRIAKAAVYQVSYDSGYPRPFAHSQILN